MSQRILEYQYENDTGWFGETLKDAESHIVDGNLFAITVTRPITKEQAKELALRVGCVVNYTEAIMPGTEIKGTENAEPRPVF